MSQEQIDQDKQAVDVAKTAAEEAGKAYTAALAKLAQDTRDHAKETVLSTLESHAATLQEDVAAGIREAIQKIRDFL